MVVGNLTVDEILHDRRVDEFPGGSAFYTSTAAAFFSAKVSLLSSIGSDYPRHFLKWLRTHRVDLSLAQFDKSPATRFQIAYRDSNRILRLLSPGARLRPRALAGHWDAVHMGPVYGEIDDSTIRIVRPHANFLSLDVQGLVRKRKPDGQLYLFSRRMDTFFRSCDLIKASHGESQAITSVRNPVRAAREIVERGPSYAIVTMGDRGSILAQKAKGLYLIPAFREKKVVDPTGAGDAMVGGWLSTFLATADPLWAAAVGSAFSSLVLRHTGFAKLNPPRTEVFRRAAKVYNGISKITGAF